MHEESESYTKYLHLSVSKVCFHLSRSLNQRSTGFFNFNVAALARLKSVGILCDCDVTACKLIGGQCIAGLPHKREAGGLVIVDCGSFAFQLFGGDLVDLDFYTILRRLRQSPAVRCGKNLAATCLLLTGF